MKTCLRLIPFMVCVALVPARGADQAPATVPAEKPAIDSASDLPKKTDPLIDPLTGTPYIAVHNGDIVECATFMIEFQRAHPEEHTLLLIGEIHDAVAGMVEPAVAFTWKGKVYFHSYEIGDVLIPDLSPEKISDGYMSRLHKAYRKLVGCYFIKSREELHITDETEEQAYQIGSADKGPHVLPNELPGDTEDIQALRVVTRLKQLGLTSAKVYNNFILTDKYGKTYSSDIVEFDFGNFAYAWEKRGCKYIGLASKTYLPSMLDSIIFSIDYQKANPAEKVFCFLHEASGEGHMPGLTVSTTVFTKNGQIWFHHLAPRDLQSSLTLDDLKDSDSVIRPPTLRSIDRP